MSKFFTWVVAVLLLCGAWAGVKHQIAEAYTAGKIEGFKEAQSADLIADRCVAFWFRDTRESTKALDRFCKRNEK